MPPPPKNPVKITLPDMTFDPVQDKEFFEWLKKQPKEVQTQYLIMLAQQNLFARIIEQLAAMGIRPNDIFPGVLFWQFC